MRAAGILAAMMTAGAAWAQVPRPSPDFNFALADGRKVSLSQYRGKVVALAFLSST